MSVLVDLLAPLSLCERFCSSDIRPGGRSSASVGLGNAGSKTARAKCDILGNLSGRGDKNADFVVNKLGL